MTHSQLGGDGTSDSLNLLSFLVSDESRHSLDSLLLSDLLDDISISFGTRNTYSVGINWNEVILYESRTHLLLLDVNFDKLDTGVFVLELGEMRGDHLAWTAPCCPEVDNDGLVTVNLDRASAWFKCMVMGKLAYESLELVVRFNSLDHD